ncbi:MAG TPA: hypothetical protein PKD09_12075 [Aggregatilinea sp.]|jgi:hypothetical protein|uniref:hypothetical protein n=1 Tax=Aggregatilinea sp. TaxID=2806333 RepID=UPI002BC15FC5|nr:hypothetical protein [Aggregatilinea sp.]HML22380.1 hypothetical protein [Aggregatilinea sp.]
MATITALDNNYVSLYYHEDKGLVHHIYKPGIGGEYLKEALNRGTDLLRQYGATKWLSDNSRIDAHTEEETEWINTHWLPNAIDAGWKYWALVVPHDFAARLNMGEFVQAFYEMGVRVAVFTDPAEAMDWITSA